MFFSHSAAQFYFQTKYPSYPECSHSCVRMDVEAKFKTKSVFRSDPAKSRTTFIFPLEVPVTEEFYTASPLSLGEHLNFPVRVEQFSFITVAEIGGYLGMLVGVSVMDVEIFVMKLSYLFKAKCCSKS